MSNAAATKVISKIVFFIPITLLCKGGGKKGVRPPPRNVTGRSYLAVKRRASAKWLVFGVTSENSAYPQYETRLLQGFEAIGSLLRPLVAARVYQAVLRQSVEEPTTPPNPRCIPCRDPPPSDSSAGPPRRSGPRWPPGTSTSSVPSPPV